jgi:hypothetical protein
VAQPRKVILHRRADMALTFLRPRDRATVKAAIRKLKDPDSAALVLASAAKALTPEPMYLMQAGPEWRIIFQEKENNEIEILDVVLADKLRAFAKKHAEADRAGAKNDLEPAEISGTNKAGPLEKPPCGEGEKRRGGLTSLDDR